MQVNAEACERCVSRNLTCYRGPGKACDPCHVNKVRCAPVGGAPQAPKTKVEAGPPIGKPKRARASSSKTVKLLVGSQTESPSSSSSSSSSGSVVETLPAKRKKSASKGKGKARLDDISGLRRALKDIGHAARLQQEAVNKLLVALARAEDRLKALEDE